MRSLQQESGLESRSVVEHLPSVHKLLGFLNPNPHTLFLLLTGSAGKLSDGVNPVSGWTHLRLNLPLQDGGVCGRHSPTGRESHTLLRSPRKHAGVGLETC